MREVFTAASSAEGVGEKKYDETAASMIALLRYGSGFPWNRLEGLEENLGIPLPVRHAMRDHGGNCGRCSNRPWRNYPPGRARGSGAQ